MLKFMIQKDGASVTLGTTLTLPQAGQTLLVKRPFWTFAGHQYEVGDELELIERTNEAPFGYKCSLGNWVVKDRFFTSIWSNIEWTMIDGMLEIKETK